MIVDDFLIFFIRNCAFVNFTNISNAIKAIDGVKNKADYANLRIAHGKDRCANPPRQGPQGGGGARRSGNALGNSPTAPHDGYSPGAEMMESDAVVLGGQGLDEPEPFALPAGLPAKPEME
jgi:hypothetical protein